MKEFVFGIIAGIITSLGMGGGAILILLLNLFTDLDQHLIQGINLIFFIPTSIAAIILNIKNKTIDYKVSTKIICFGIIGALIGSYISFVIDEKFLKKCFGIFLIIIAIFEIFTFFRQYILAKKEK